MKKVKIGNYTLDELPSGSLRLRKMHKGTTYTLVFDYKPKEKEIVQALAAEMEKVKTTEGKMTFKDAADKYVESKRNVLSPRTIMEYSRMCKRLSDWFIDTKLSDIDQIAINRQVNELACNKKPKTVACLHGFITAILGVYRPDLKITTRLPQKVKNEPYIPTDEDVKTILKHVKDTQFEIPIVLACYGMRRSEICALQVEDIDGDVVKINKALVQNDKKEWVVKSTKTTESTREIIIPMDIADKIRAQGYVYKGYPGSISNHLTRLQKELEMEHFSLHKLRHYFASKLSSLNVPEADILRLGGWETDHVMKTVYRHSMMEKEKAAQRETSDKLRKALFS